MNNILIIDDDIAITESLRFALRKKYNLYIANDYWKGLDIFINKDIDLILLDLRLGKDDGLDLYEKIKEIDQKAIVVIITAFGTIESSKVAIKSGVFDYLTKPICLEQLYSVIEKGLDARRKIIDIRNEKEDNLDKYSEMGIVHESESMRNILKIVEKIKKVNSNILITGESGTGKTLLSKAIHQSGNRSNKPFYSINCAAIPKELLESELFGYKKGAFTGAGRNKKGYFEIADGGTLLLDEVGEMDGNVQTKLLKVIQDKVFTPLGSTEQIKTDIRIIAATNADLKELIEKKKFREDLYYRLNVINIDMPPLRERKEDINYLAKYFVDKYSKIMNKNINSVESDFISELEKLEFKGNIRELENIIESSIALSDGEILKKDDLIRGDIVGQINREDKTGKIIPVFIGESIETIEKRVILMNYKFYDENQKLTAQKLGITDRTIRNKLKKYKEEENNS